MKNAVIGCLLFFLLFSMGCGFHLRHEKLHLGNKYPTIILPYSGGQRFHQMLVRALGSSSIHVIEQSSSNPSDLPLLQILSQEVTQEPLVYGPDSELRRERLKMTMVFSFKVISSKQFELFAIRDRQLYSSQHLGDNAEKVLIEQEMQADIIQQLLRYMENEHF